MLDTLTEGAAQVGKRQRVQPADLPVAYALLEEASRWLCAKGLSQWNPVYPIERFTADVHAGMVWHWQAGGETLATVTLLPHRPDYYPAGFWDDSVPAWYVCRFAVARKLKGHRVGAQLLEELATDGARCEIRALRLDVAASNP